jgi:hypothetical protein
MPPSEEEIMNETVSALQRLSLNLKALNVSILTASIVAAANRPHSVEDVVKLREDIDNAINPRPKHKPYNEWVETSKDRLSAKHT